MANAHPGHFVWHEHLTHDRAAAIAFYGEVIGWKTQPFGDGNEYMMWVGTQGPLGGVMKLPAEAVKMGAPPHWMAHVQVDNVDAKVEQVKKLGGRIYKEPTDVSTVGRFAIIADPQGAAISIFKPVRDMTRHDAAHAGEFCWAELVTSDASAAIKFYGDVFGWKVLQEMNMGDKGTYSIYGLDGEQLGGIMNTPPGMPMPPMWIYYTETNDVGAAVARATKMGAKLLFGPMEIPGGGRIAQLTDPQGALFALHQAPVSAKAS